MNFLISFGGIFLNLFFDTNVIVGYLIGIDPWHYFSLRVFNIDKSKYWSYYVKDESRNVLKRLLLEYNGFFSQIKDSILVDFISKKEFFRNLSEINYVDGQEVSFDQERIADLIWSEGGWYKQARTCELFNLLDSILEDMNETVFPNFENCNVLLKFHQRKNDYKTLLSDLDSLKECFNGKLNTVHNPDDKIILDAHDLALSKNFDLYFITADKKLLRFSEDILNLTNLKGMFFVEDAYFKVR